MPPWNAIICGLAMHGCGEESLRIFSDLHRTNVKLNSIRFIGVLTACCHAGLVESGEKHFKSMQALYWVKPNIKSYKIYESVLYQISYSDIRKNDVHIFGQLHLSTY